MSGFPVQSQNMPLRVRAMTFNIRFDTPRDGPDNMWASRRPAAAEVVRRYAPDVVGIQEALEHQIRDLTDDLPAYACLGRGRELKGGGEFVPLLYRQDRFELEQWGVFWLSESPDIEGSLGWDADAPRICTWAVLRDAATSRSFFAANTHLDRWGSVAREESAELLIMRMSRFAGIPALVTGDLNGTEDDPPFKVLAGAMLRDSYRDIDQGTAPPTIHHYGERLGGKIDFVLCDPSWRVLGAEVAADRPFDQWPSDHYPVLADLELIDETAT
jgi:endonuclease/exonuclease/phosphatase family metal-dependent hydrolase